MRRPGAYLQTFRDGHSTAEYDSFSCSHCNCTVILKAGVDPTHSGAIVAAQPHWQSDGMEVCLACTDGQYRGLICPACAKEQHRLGRCVNFERRLEMSEKRRYTLGTWLPD